MSGKDFSHLAQNEGLDSQMIEMKKIRRIFEKSNKIIQFFGPENDGDKEDNNL